ncbi:MAG: glycerophosphodiester phosphodiesterase family protein [Actinomycetota bacterium]
MARRAALTSVLAIGLLAACTATDSTTGPIATPRPTSSIASTPTPIPTATPAPPVPTPTPDPELPAAQRPTIDELLALDVPLNIAHAGGDQIAPHSTLYAMAVAVEAGANVLELDVRLTADAQLVVHHDDTVDRTTGATGRVDDLTLAELQALDNAHWFSPECWPCQDRPIEEYIYRGIRTGEVAPPEGATPDDFAVPTFRDVVERFPTMAFDVEIKGSGLAAVGTASVLAGEIAALGIGASTVVVSFDDAALRTFETLAPAVETSPARSELTDWFLLQLPLDGDHRIIQVPPAFEGVPVLTESFWERAEAAGLDVWVWMDDPRRQENLEFYQELIAQGADGIIAGRPNEMAAALL